MKKRIISIILAVATVSLVACGKNDVKTVTLENGETVEAKEIKEVIREVVIDNIEAKEDDEYTFGPASIVCNIPAGFEEGDFSGEYLHKSYPKDISSINQVISESDIDPTVRSKEDFELSVEKEYKDAYGDDVDINISQYDKITVDGRPGLWIMYNFKFRNEGYEVLEIILYNGDESNYITYLQGPGADWMKDFVDSAMSISFMEN